MSDHVINGLWDQATTTLPQTIISSLQDLQAALPHNTVERLVVTRMMGLVNTAQQQNSSDGFVQKLFGNLFNRDYGGIDVRHPLNQFLEIFAPQMHMEGKELKSRAISMIFGALHQVHDGWRKIIERTKETLPDDEVVTLPQEKTVRQVGLFLNAAQQAAQRGAEFAVDPDVLNSRRTTFDLTSYRPTFVHTKARSVFEVVAA